MIAQVNGIVVDIKLDRVYVATRGGVTYEVYVTARIVDNLNEGEEILLNTFHYISEKREELYGFRKVQNKDFFDKLLDISGVGPVSALEIVNFLSYKDFAEVIREKDVAKLCKVKGIGKKTAQRIMIDLSEKLDLESIDSKSKLSDELREKKKAVKGGLKSLGFKVSEIEVMMEDIDDKQLDNNTVDNLILKALKNKD